MTAQTCTHRMSIVCRGALTKELGSVSTWLDEQGYGGRKSGSEEGAHSATGTTPRWPLPAAGPSLEAPLLAALAPGGPLAGSAAAVEAVCGLDPPALASAVGRISTALQGLLADRGALSRIAEEQGRRWQQEEHSSEDGTRAFID
ncbi:hypothetical protein GPECTOR_99g815 [Gonium pectorale]|uniref:Uncharacterized protein n=1 Tax=Gonium pectorale TaxID=33097 RepID=A0A150G1L8_GONPE|nr:hypothetical protein GPECTOR_99g815 [Gonium pectorale]|eukprot:KXZ43180.1 hypothetical protein GPECTOR_99g815 [Gonium pectorale]